MGCPVENDIDNMLRQREREENERTAIDEQIESNAPVIAHELMQGLPVIIAGEVNEFHDAFTLVFDDIELDEKFWQVLRSWCLCSDEENKRDLKEFVTTHVNGFASTLAETQARHELTWR